MTDRAELLMVIEELVRTFAYLTYDDDVPVLTTGGLWALEDAFTVLGWDNPHSIDDRKSESRASIIRRELMARNQSEGDNA